ncbi:RusA family crossover junction endodeoxyribonuclease [Chloroflexota bacterium]
MTTKNKAMVSTPPSLKLEDCLGSYEALGEIKSGSRYKKKTIQDIKKQLHRWMNAESFKPVKGKKLDVAIVIKCSPTRYKNQDTDNISKIICDALKEKKGDYRYLFNDDSQIIRLLVWKMRRTDNAHYGTDSYAISFRIHAPNKQMTLVQSIQYLTIK